MRRMAPRILLLLCAVACGVCTAAVRYPERPIRMIQPFAPGGGVEAQARVVGQALASALGQPVVIDSRPGAGGALGTQIAAQATPDGHTLLFTNSAFAIAPIFSAKPLFDPQRDFAPVIQIGTQPQILVAHPSLPPTLPELLQAARQQPGKLSFGSPGTGTMSQLTMELLKSMARVDLLHVPYKGSAPAVTALLSGEVQLAIFSANVVMPHVRAGRLRALGVTSLKRVASLPEVPAIAAAGLPAYETTQWSGMFAPARTPRPIVLKLNAALSLLLQTDEVRQRLSGMGLEVTGGSPEQLAAYVREETARWSTLINEAGLRAR